MGAVACLARRPPITKILKECFGVRVAGLLFGSRPSSLTNCLPATGLGRVFIQNLSTGATGCRTFATVVLGMALRSGMPRLILAYKLLAKLGALVAERIWGIILTMRRTGTTTTVSTASA